MSTLCDDFHHHFRSTVPFLKTYERDTHRESYTTFVRHPEEESPSFCQKICHRSILKLNCPWLIFSFRFRNGSLSCYIDMKMIRSLKLCRRVLLRWSHTLLTVDPKKKFSNDLMFNPVLVSDRKFLLHWINSAMKKFVDRFIIHLSMNMLELIRVFVQTYRWVHAIFLEEIWQYEMNKELTKIKIFLSANFFDWRSV